MKKRKYSSVLSVCWKMYSHTKEQYPEYSVEQIYTMIHDQYEQRLTLTKNDINTFVSQRSWELWLSDYRREMLHVFFLNLELRNVLENIKVRIDNAKEFVKANGSSEIMWCEKYHGNIDVQIFCFAVHLPFVKAGYAFKLMLYDNQLVVFCIQEDLGGFEITEDQYNYAFKMKENEKKVRIFQLCINTLLYMDCYPEYIKEGVPDEWCEIDNSTKKVQVSVSPDLDEIIKTGGVKSPYMKGAYFMTFKDERYTKMRGKSVLVKARFIKGHAVTAESADDYSRLL